MAPPHCTCSPACACCPASLPFPLPRLCPRPRPAAPPPHLPAAFPLVLGTPPHFSTSLSRLCSLSHLTVVATPVPHRPAPPGLSAPPHCPAGACLPASLPCLAVRLTAPPYRSAVLTASSHRPTALSHCPVRADFPTSLPSPRNSSCAPCPTSLPRLSTLPRPTTYLSSTDCPTSLPASPLACTACFTSLSDRACWRALSLLCPPRAHFSPARTAPPLPAH